jgi:hypothetical protein
MRDTKMPDEEWIKTLEDGRTVKSSYQQVAKTGIYHGADWRKCGRLFGCADQGSKRL